MEEEGTQLLASSISLAVVGLAGWGLSTAGIPDNYIG